MPSIKDGLPDIRQRAALNALRNGGWLTEHALYPAGPGAVTRMVASGWIERSSDEPSLFRITQAGLAALVAEIRLL
jgi:hypothetical protein